MGCVQSQPSHPSKHHSSSMQRPSQHHPTSKRRSQEFYHQYQQPTTASTHPHNYQKHNISPTNASSAVITGKENLRQRNTSKNHNKVKTTIFENY